LRIADCGCEIKRTSFDSAIRNPKLNHSHHFTNPIASVRISRDAIPYDPSRLDLEVLPKEEPMAAEIPEKYRDLFDKKAFAHLATLNSDGTPQVTPVWVDYDGDYIVVNSARGRRKDKNMERNRAVALSIQDPENPYRYLEVRGRVEEITEDGADQHIDKMAKKYMGVDKYPLRQPSEKRVMYKIKPEHTSQMG